MKVALCSPHRQFHQDRLRERSWSQQFLGSAWATSLYERAEELGIELASGDVALQNVKCGRWQAGEVHVVQEQDARHGIKLCQLGAIPSILMMFESPLIAYRSVDRLMRSSFRFAHCIGPHPVFEAMPALRQARHWRLMFPSFWRDQVPPQVNWHERKHAVLVAANKYWREERAWKRARTPKDHLRVVYEGLRKPLSPTYQSCRKLQLHDARIELLHELGLRNEVEVYGRGWSDTGNMPPKPAARIDSIASAFRGPCGDKHALLSQYKFAITYENTAYPGYVTEKIIDAIVSASIPVYLGAPDIAEQLPASIFIDARAFDTPAAIANHLEQLGDSGAADMIDAGQLFLSSDAGQRYSYEDFATWVVSLLSEVNGNGFSPLPR